jgi:hypothetical protein
MYCPVGERIGDNALIEKPQRPGSSTCPDRTSGLPVCREMILKHAVRKNDYLRQIGEPDRIDDKTAFIIKSE